MLSALLVSVIKGLYPSQGMSEMFFAIETEHNACIGAGHDIDAMFREVGDTASTLPATQTYKYDIYKMDSDLLYENLNEASKEIECGCWVKRHGYKYASDLQEQGQD